MVVCGLRVPKLCILGWVIGLIEFVTVLAFGAGVISELRFGFLGDAVAGAHKIIDIKLIYLGGRYSFNLLELLLFVN